ncbi:unnamed protein product [Moneuplotes crassus]|uniref:Uncharacterized protein n=2 Tax=Euplotes crassus TaxID=5936 RepID=A0AAD2D1S1_EUPCR|nr:unnamed protein product [Moneuplotes crassus]
MKASNPEQSKYKSSNTTGPSEPSEPKKKTLKNYTKEFEQKAARNSEELMRTHEFRKENIKEMELEEKDYFEYDPNEPERYASLDPDYMFKFETTFSSIKWGIFVGSLFALHRYHRTRDVNNAAHWFTVMSFFSFFNIWVSNSIQHFISDYSVRKSVSLGQRNEFQKDAYENYFETVEKRVKVIDKELKVQPIMKNSQAESLNEFITSYQDYLKAKFESGKAVDIFGNILRYNKLGEQIVKEDVYNQKLSLAEAREKALKVIKNIEEVDLKSYDFENDPDCVYI